MTDRVVMADDGRGITIHIPAFLISKQNGGLIKNTLIEGQHVVI
jgi:hypothetical protein